MVDAMRYGPRVHVALIGLRGAGKSSVGRALAPLLGRTFVDLDHELALAAERVLGPPLLPAGEVLAREGEAFFRDTEEEVLAETLQAPRPIVLATGGGAVERSANRQRLAGLATCVWLEVEPDELARRLRADPSPRPPLVSRDPVTEAAAIDARRRPLYRALADLRVSCGRRDPDALAAEIARALAGGDFAHEG
jgi:shikimate kinase